MNQQQTNHNKKTKLHKSEAEKKDILRKNMRDLAKYSSLAFQMLFIILIGTLGGIQLDKLVNFEFPIFTLSLTILSVAGALYYALKDFIKK